MNSNPTDIPDPVVVQTSYRIKTIITSINFRINIYNNMFNRSIILFGINSFMQMYTGFKIGHDKTMYLMKSDFMQTWTSIYTSCIVFAVTLFAMFF